MAETTRLRGPLDTLPQRRLPGDSRLWLMLVASVLVHALITGGPALLNLVGFLSFDDPASDEPLVDAIPVELLSEGPAPEEAPAPAAPAEPETPTAPPTAAPASTDAEAPKPAPKAVVPKAPAETGGGLRDPIKQAGLAGKAVDSNANVRLLLHMEAIRQSPFGAQVGSLLERTPQWSDFFGAAGVNAVRDIDHILVAGPQLRDSSNVVAVVQHHLSEELVTAAFERLAARGGEWVERSPQMVRARADRATRLFVAPAKHLVAVVPPSAEKSARGLSKKDRFGAGDPGVALSAYIVTPWRVGRGIGIKLPESLEWARIEVSPTADGGAQVRIEALDGSPEQAKENAARLEKLLVAASTLDFGGMFGFGGKKKFVERIEFSSKDKTITGLLVLTKKQLASLLDMADAFLPPLPPTEKFKPAEPAPSGPAPTSSAPESPSPAAQASSAPAPETPVPPSPAPETAPAPPADPPPAAPSPSL